MILNGTPLLWLSGPPGCGKTAVGWETFSRLSDAGVEVGYVDIDQLGICFPEPEGDSGRHHMKATNVDRVVATLRQPAPAAWSSRE